ncbi:MAG TPA: sigma factor [Urbifossiella sp.]|nr:sigma factor [Urbifossiella sp.]
MHTTSLSLLARLQARSDGDSWQRLVDLYQPLLRGYAAAAHDLVQDVLVVLLRELPEFRRPGHTGAFRCWLRGILVNRLRALWRAGRGRGAAGDSDFLQLADRLADPDTDLSRRWDEQHDREVLARLPHLMEAEFEPKTLLAFRRVGQDGARPREVAAELGMSVGRSTWPSRACSAGSGRRPAASWDRLAHVLGPWYEQIHHRAPARTSTRPSSGRPPS